MPSRQLRGTVAILQLADKPENLDYQSGDKWANPASSSPMTLPVRYAATRRGQRRRQHGRGSQRDAPTQETTSTSPQRGQRCEEELEALSRQGVIGGGTGVGRGCRRSTRGVICMASFPPPIDELRRRRDRTTGSLQRPGSSGAAA
ncbi:MAG: hypothetical protein ACLTQI_03475 [Slackia sp.]